MNATNISNLPPPRVQHVPELRLMAIEVEVLNREKGWYDEPRTFGEDIALLHSEVSEALEAWREHGAEDATRELDEVEYLEHRAEWGGEGPPLLAKPEGVPSELADVLVRLLDTCQWYNVDLFAEWRRKMDYNWTRPRRHGYSKGKRL